MQVTVKLFATLRHAAGWAERKMDLDAGATVDTLIDALAARESKLELEGRTLYVAVNQEYADRDHGLSDGDEVALFPPVSGGVGRTDRVMMGETKFFELTEQPLSLDEVSARVTRPDCGGIALFSGTVRGETAVDDGTRGTDFLVYEAYAGMAEQMLAKIGDEIMGRWPKVKAVSIMHIMGRCNVGEPSVVIAVATPHRNDGCFEACQYAIERLKAIVPIWKQENWSDGQVWVEGPRQPELDVATPEKS